MRKGRTGPSPAVLAFHIQQSPSHKHLQHSFHLSLTHLRATGRPEGNRDSQQTQYRECIFTVQNGWQEFRTLFVRTWQMPSQCRRSGMITTPKTESSSQGTSSWYFCLQGQCLSSLSSVTHWVSPVNYEVEMAD